MAEKRMFSKAIIDSDAFLEMPLSTQALYFHLSMRADDDGFVNNPKRIMRLVNCSEDDIRVLIARNFLIPFDSGVVVIKHWKIHNYIQKDRYKETNYLEEKKMLTVKPNKAYSLASAPMDTGCIQDGYSLDTQIRIDKNRLDKDRLDKSSSRRFKPPTLDEVQAYIDEKSYPVNANTFYDYYSANGWKVGKNPMKDWKAAVRYWASKPEDAGKGKGNTQSSRRELFARLYEEHKDDL